MAVIVLRGGFRRGVRPTIRLPTCRCRRVRLAVIGAARSGSRGRGRARRSARCARTPACAGPCGPSRPGRADRLGVLEAGNVVAAEAAVLGDRPPADVHQLLPLHFGWVEIVAEEINLGSLQLASAGHGNAVLDVLLGLRLGEHRSQIFQSDFVEILLALVAGAFGWESPSAANHRSISASKRQYRPPCRSHCPTHPRWYSSSKFGINVRG